MAEGLMRKIAGDAYDVFSAGTHPKGLHPMSVEVMKELEIDISHQTSKDVRTFLGQQFDFVITVCGRAKQECPVFPGSTPIHWGLDDPAETAGSPEAQQKAFRTVRDEILQQLRLFVAANNG